MIFLSKKDPKQEINFFLAFHILWNIKIRVKEIGSGVIEKQKERGKYIYLNEKRGGFNISVDKLDEIPVYLKNEIRKKTLNKKKKKNIAGISRQ